MAEPYFSVSLDIQHIRKTFHVYLAAATTPILRAYVRLNGKVWADIPENYIAQFSFGEDFEDSTALITIDGVLKYDDEVPYFEFDITSEDIAESGDYFAQVMITDDNEIPLEKYVFGIGTLHLLESPISGEHTAAAFDKNVVDWDLIENQGTVPWAEVTGVWGTIDGNISDQTDLQTELDNKANVSGQIFTGEISATNLSGINTGDQDISGIANNASEITANANDIVLLNSEMDTKANVSGQAFTGDITASNLSGTNTGDQDLSTIEADIIANTVNILNNATDITTNEIDIASNASNVASNADNIADNETDILNNTSNVASNADNIAINAGDIIINASNISDNADNISDNEADISNVASNVSTNAGNIAINTADIATNEINITALDIRVSDNETDISNVASDVATNEINIAQNTSNVSNVASDVSDLEIRVSDNETDILLKADKTNVLELDNTDVFVPDEDYEPATKKYVDDHTGDLSGLVPYIGATGNVDLGSNSLVLDNGVINNFSTMIRLAATDTNASAGVLINENGNIVLNVVDSDDDENAIRFLIDNSLVTSWDPDGLHVIDSDLMFGTFTDRNEASISNSGGNLNVSCIDLHINAITTCLADTEITGTLDMNTGQIINIIDNPYSVFWSNNTSAPNKKAIYAKIETEVARITANASDITDLDTNKVPYSGANNNVDLGVNDLTADVINASSVNVTNNLAGSSASFTSNITASNLSGTNTGDQDISGLVPYSGANANVDLGSYNLETNGEITTGSLSVNGDFTALDVNVASLTSNGNISTGTHVTASGNITALGTISGSNLSGSNTGDQDLSVIESDITDLELQQAINTLDISNAASDISTNEVNIATNEINIAQNTLDISNVASDISTNEINIAQNTLDISNVASDITTLDTNKVPYTGANANVDLGTYDLITQDISTGSSAYDLTIDCGTEKTLVLEEAVWDDQQIAIGNAHFKSGAPDWVTFRNGPAIAFADSGTEGMEFNMQLTHKYKLNTDVEFHLHTSSKTTNTGNVRWKLTVSMADIGGTFPVETEYFYTQEIGTSIEYGHVIAEISENIGSASGVSSVWSMSLERLGSDALDTYTGDIILIGLDAHIQIDTQGSRQEYVK